MRVARISRHSSVFFGIAKWTMAAAPILFGCTRTPTGASPPEGVREVHAAPAPVASTSAPPLLPATTSAVVFASGPYTLRGYVLKPAGAGPFPVLVYNHGSEADPDLDWLRPLAEWFVSKGYIAFFPFRRGAGGSTGPRWETVVDARPRDERNVAVVEQLDAQNDDVLAAIDWIADQPYVDRSHIAVSGCSFGGIETVLTAARSKAIYAAVDFAGASMSWASSPALQDRMRAAVREARVPILFLQAENDFNTAPSRALAAEMSSVGKPHALSIFPPHGETHREGHAGFCMRGTGEWGDTVMAFLKDPSAPLPKP